MFTGEYRHSIDAKGRLIVPVKLRESLGDKFFIVKGADKCLNLYTYEEWEKFVAKLAKLPEGNANARKLVRFYLSSAFEVEVDKQARILIPQLHREYAKIDKDVVLSGEGNKVGIWSVENWDEISIDNEEATEISNEFADFLR
ncbi:MAG: division/cell wall cluster transcriptional repressor MraZ [Lachnospiraceae bacterium]|nr:division/cell wall cluster transcriptional repressor MraZ [Lachnospiraceae bacterium]